MRDRMRIKDEEIVNEKGESRWLAEMSNWEVSGQSKYFYIEKVIPTMACAMRRCFVETDDGCKKWA